MVFEDSFKKGFQRPLKFRPPGSPAGTWPTTPWWHCVLYDPYERGNVWSHLLPGILFLVIGAATTHLLSALTHVYPDDHFLEKLDHLGIAGLIVGTTSTAIMVTYHQPRWEAMAIVCTLLVAAAFLRPLMRTMTFILLGLVLFVAYFPVVNANLLCQCLSYCAGAIFFLRSGGHDRPLWLCDHHILHYAVTIACMLHLSYLWGKAGGVAAT